MLRVCRYVPPHQRQARASGRLDGNDLWLLSAALVWAGNAVLAKYLLQAVPPLAVLLVRMVGVAVALALALAVLRRPWPPRRLLLPLLLAGLVLAGQNLTFYLALRLTTASEGALLVNTSPLWIALLLAGCRLEALRPRNWAGLLLASGGVALLLLAARPQMLQYAPAPLAGNALMLLSAVLFAVYLVLVKGWMEQHGALPVLASSFAVSAVVSLPLGLGPLLAADWGALTLGHWAALAYTVLLAGGYAFLAWYHVVGRTSATRVALYQYLVPILAVLLARLGLGEQLTPGQLLGIAIALAGVYLARPGAPRPEACPGHPGCS